MEEQNGPQHNKGCADATFSLKSALKTLQQHNNKALSSL